MKTKKYTNGKITFKSYFKKVGHGYECGVIFGGKPVFVGNFVKSAEANAWWTKMDKEIKTFSNRYWVSETAPKNWYKNFLTHHLYTTYYTYLDKLFTKHTREYTRAYKKDFKRYQQLRKKWTTGDRTHFKTKAA